MQVNKGTGCLSKDYKSPELRWCWLSEEDIVRTSGENEDEVGVAWSNKWIPGTN